jgi:hypothetical protein
MNENNATTATKTKGKKFKWKKMQKRAGTPENHNYPTKLEFHELEL